MVASSGERDSSLFPSGNILIKDGGRNQNKIIHSQKEKWSH
jgi:hypothetical protein